VNRGESETMTTAMNAAITDQSADRPVIVVEGLHVSYPIFGAPPIQAVNGIDLTIHPGEILGLVGESNSGKTTLARAIMRLLVTPGRMDGGKIIFDGQDLALLSDEEIRQLRGMKLAMIIPNPRGELNPLLRVGQQIANVAQVHLGDSHKQAWDRAIEMLRIVRIPDPERRIRAFPHELSGGMAQRLVMAISLVCSPRFLISDDATSGLDVTVQAQVLDHMSKLVRDNNTAMLLITRDIAITAHYCDRVAVIYSGRIVELGETVDFFDNPMHPYSIMLLAAFSHNPTLRNKWTKGNVEAGLKPETDGCPFHPRCVKAKERCFRDAPALSEWTPGHLIRCHFPVMR